MIPGQKNILLGQRAAYKRINNILKSEKFSNDVALKVNTKVFDTIEEQNLFNLSNSFSKEIIKNAKTFGINTNEQKKNYLIEFVSANFALICAKFLAMT